MRRALRRPAPLSWPYPGWSGARQVLGNVGLEKTQRTDTTTTSRATCPKSGTRSSRIGHATLRAHVSGQRGGALQNDVPAGEAERDLADGEQRTAAATRGRSTDLVRHPRALYLQVAAAHPAQLRRELRLALDHFHNVRCAREHGGHRRATRTHLSCSRALQNRHTHGEQTHGETTTAGARAPFQMPVHST